MTIEIKTKPSLLSLGSGETEEDDGYRVPDGMMLVGVMIPVEHAPHLTGMTPVTLTLPDPPAVMPAPREPEPTRMTCDVISPEPEPEYEYGLQWNDNPAQPIDTEGLTNAEGEKIARSASRAEQARQRRAGNYGYESHATRRALPDAEWERLA